MFTTSKVNFCLSAVALSIFYQLAASGRFGSGTGREHGCIGENRLTTGEDID